MDNETINSTLPTEVYYNDYALWFEFVSYWELMIMIIGTPANLFVIYIWFTLSQRSSNRRFSVQSRNRWFILGITMADLIFTSIHAPLIFLWYGGRIHMTDGPCYMWYGATHLSTTASSMNLLLLNVDKFIYLHWPLHYYAIMTNLRAMALACGAWLACVCYMFTFLFGPFLDRYAETDALCAWKSTDPDFYISALMVFFVMPIVLSAATSLYIAIVAVRASLKEAASQAAYGNISTQTEDIGDSTTQNMNGRKIAMCTPPTVKPWRTITFVFTTTIWSTFTYLPYRISLIVYIVLGKKDPAVNFPLFALMVLCPAGNPFITILTQPPYRKRAVEIFQNLKRFMTKTDIDTPVRRK